MKPSLADATEGIGPLDAVRILRVAGGALFEQSTLHAQLAQVELEQARQRLLKRSMVLLLGFACLVSTLLSAGALVLMASWDTAYRMPAAAGIVSVYGVATLVAAWRFRRLGERDHHVFAASREEIAADLALLRASV